MKNIHLLFLLLFAETGSTVYANDIDLQPKVDRTESRIFNENDPKKITGLVRDEQGIPVIGASVIEKGTSNGTITDLNGAFNLQVTSENATLIISYIGYHEKEISIKGKSNIDISIEEDIQMLDEVVAVGYGTMKKSSLTGSVSKVDGESVSGFPSVNVVDALQGRAPGVYINPSRQPGEDPTIRIRGSRSLNASNSPLLIVDGMPGTWENVSSDNIESIEVLKDAAATAIYGSRAANGVIIVTTKSAKKGGKLNIEINSYVGFNTYNFVEMQSPEKYNAMIRDVMRFQSHGLDKEAWENSDIDLRKGLEMFDPLWAENYYEKGVNFDWRDALLNKSSVNTGHSISLGQTTDKISYNLSYNYQNDNSYYKTLNYQRHILNSSVKFTPNKVIDFGLITKLSYRKNTGWPGNTYEALRRMTPFETPYIDEDPSKGLKKTIGREGYVNALWNYEDGHFVDDKTNKKADIIFSANIRPVSWLTLSSNLKLGFNERSEGTYYDALSTSQNLGYNSASLSKKSDFDYTWNGIITLNKTFGSHKIIATAVMEAIQEKSDNVYASAQDIPAMYMDYHFLQSGTVNQNLSSNYNKSALLSYLGRIQYEFKDRYLFNVALRYDGSSKLAEGNKWKLFPSASAAWRVSEEGFLADNDIISNLKLRASYGEIGNQAISSYQTMTRLKSKTYSWAGAGFYTWQPDGLANKDLGWEVSKTLNVGIDLGLDKNLYGASIEFYNTRNVDLLMNRSIPETTGFANLWQNIGTTQNRGIEATFFGTPLHTKDLNWILTANVSRNWNKIIELLDGKDDLSSKWFIGKPIGVYFNHIFDGIWQLEDAEEAKKYNQEAGQVRVKDLDNDGKITEDDKVILGQKEPKILASLQSSFRWKDLDFTFNLVGQFGNMVEAGNYQPLWNAENWIMQDVDWWTPLNPTNKWPRVQSSITQPYTSTLILFKGDFIKLQDICIGYDFTKLVSPYFKVNKLRLYLEGRNIAYLHKSCPKGINPEQPNSIYTLPTSFVFGVNLSF